VHVSSEGKGEEAQKGEEMNYLELWMEVNLQRKIQMETTYKQRGHLFLRWR